MSTNDIIDEILQQIKQPLWENWYIKEKIGSGAFSAVYRVEAKRSSRRTAVAALKIEPITAEGSHFFDEQRKMNFIESKKRAAESEAEIMYNLRRCENIVAYEEEDFKELYINGVFEGYYYLIRMEYLNAISSLIHSRKFDFSEKNIIRLANHIGRGIMAAHRHGIIHRDIKLDNFFVDDFGTYKLGDFNISKKTGAARTFAGTPGYLAPEIYRAKSNIDEVYTDQADIYSFGICLYQLGNELLFPFEEEFNYDLDQAIDKRMSGVELPPPKAVSPELARIILKACEFDTEKRYKTIEELLDDIAILKMRQSSEAPAAKPADDLPKMKSPSVKPDSPKKQNDQKPADNQPHNANGNAFANNNLAGMTLPAILNEDIHRNNHVADMQYNLKTDGEFVEFGNYYVAVNNPKMPLRWRILAIEEDKALIVTFMGIDVMNFNNKPGASSWADSSIRRWLNNEFYSEAFSDSEKKLIVEADLMNYKNVAYRTENGGRTKDNVFLLSVEEAERYFPTNEDRVLKPTAYARNKGLLTADNGTVWWWTRSSGNTEAYAADIDYGGDIDSYGSDRFYGVNCVRPAIWISLSFLNENRRTSFKQSFINSHQSFYISQKIPVKSMPSFRKIKFGQYFYSDGFSKLPLEWYLLTTENKKALLITVNGIDCLPYNTEPTFSTWENSQLRRWLNTDFLNTAFIDKERKLIKSVTITNSDNPVFNTKGGKSTTDKLFLLDVNEVDKYFQTTSDKLLEATPYAKGKGLPTANNGCSWWWLRTPGNVQYYAADVDYGGDVDYYGNSVSLGMNAVRPAVWVDIKALDMNN